MEYGKCECGGSIIEETITYYRKFNKKLYAFENVPIGICPDCGERIFKGRVLEELEELITKHKTPAKEIKVPVYPKTRSVVGRAPKNTALAYGPQPNTKNLYIS